MIEKEGFVLGYPTSFVKGNFLDIELLYLQQIDRWKDWK